MIGRQTLGYALLGIGLPLDVFGGMFLYSCLRNADSWAATPAMGLIVGLAFAIVIGSRRLTSAVKG